MWFLLGLFIIFTVIFVVWYWILIDNNLYCKFYHREDRKRWKQFIDMASDFYCSQSEPSEFSIKIFRDDSGKYEAVIWKNGLCSIHSTEENCKCFVSTFDKTMSKKMSDLLIKNSCYSDNIKTS